MLRRAARRLATSTVRCANGFSCPNATTASFLTRRGYSNGVDDGASAASGETPTNAEDNATATAAPVERRMTNSARRVREHANASTTPQSWGWLYDLTDSGETADRWTNGANAKLSDRAKTQMYVMHKQDPETWSVEALATKYRVRLQRVGAILALKKREEAAVEANETLYHDIEADVEAMSGAVDVGSGERHVSDVPTMPRFQLVGALETGRDAKPKKFIEASVLAKQQEKVLVKEFFERMEFNMGERAPGLIRGNRRKHAPPRPEGGYALHVTPLGDEAAEPYIAYKNGTRRPLNEDEAEHARQKTPKRRRRII